jgi:hypothetical protein
LRIASSSSFRWSPHHPISSVCSSFSSAISWLSSTVFPLLAHFSCTTCLSASVSSHAFTPSLCLISELFYPSYSILFLSWFLWFMKAVLVYTIGRFGVRIFTCFFMVFYRIGRSSLPRSLDSLLFGALAISSLYRLH